MCSEGEYEQQWKLFFLRQNDRFLDLSSHLICDQNSHIFFMCSEGEYEQRWRLFFLHQNERFLHL